MSHNSLFACQTNQSTPTTKLIASTMDNPPVYLPFAICDCLWSPLYLRPFQGKLTRLGSGGRGGGGGDPLLEHSRLAWESGQLTEHCPERAPRPCQRQRGFGDSSPPFRCYTGPNGLSFEVRHPLRTGYVARDTPRAGIIVLFVREWGYRPR